MATGEVHDKQIKLRKISQFRPWIWCLLLKILISFPCTLSLCLGVNIGITVYPKGDVFVPYGSPLELFCISENSLVTADDLEFSLSGKVLPTVKFNDTAIKLYIEKPQYEKNPYAYYCRCKKYNKICTSRIIVEGPPKNITDFNCWSKNLEVLKCNWTSVSNIKTDYNVSFKVNSHEVDPCIAKRSNKRGEEGSMLDVWYCEWNTTTKPSYRQQLDYYEFSLTSCNYFNCGVQNFTIDHFAVVIPDAPELSVTVTGPHSVKLQWKISNNMYNLLGCGVDFKIEYQTAKIDNITQFHEVNTSIINQSKKSWNYSLDVELPYAYRQYEVRIYMKTKRAGEKYWSPFNYKTFITGSEIPRRPPDMIAGSFDQGLYMTNRLINVYWKQLEDYEEAGANFTYKVVVTQNNKKITLFPDKSKTGMSYVAVNNASLGSLNVKVWSFNVKGSSKNYSELYIPSKADIEPLTSYTFTQVANKNGTYELSWEGSKRIDNYSLFWCEHISPKVCFSPMYYKVLSADRNNYVIHLPNSDRRYQFAISANKGTATSGMIWATCDIAKEGIKLYNFPVKIKHYQIGRNYVELGWSLNCALKEKIITGYNITYCPVIEDSTVCDEDVGNKSVYISDPNQMNMNITGLLSCRTYQFSMALDTTGGLKSVENNTHSVTTLEDAPTKPRNILISNVTYSSLVISWDPPLKENGKIHEYVNYRLFNRTTIENTSKKLYRFKDNKRSRRSLEITGLEPFANYSFFVQACNINDLPNYCSEVSPSDTILLTTAIGPPSKIKAPNINNIMQTLEWIPPISYGKQADLYQIQIIRDGKMDEIDIRNATDTKYEIKSHCDNVKEVSYQVRGVNFDEHPNHGVLTTSSNVKLPERTTGMKVYEGEWSDKAIINCEHGAGMTMVYIIIILFALLGMGYGSFKFYKKYKKIQDIKPALPIGLNIPEKEISKYPFISNNDEKPSSDEMLLLPNHSTNTANLSSLKKEENDNCGASDHTDSTALSDSSRKSCLVDRQHSTSDESTNSSLQLEGDNGKAGDNREQEDQEDNSCESSTEEASSPENSPYLNDNTFKKNPASGYVQPHIVPTGHINTPIQTTSSAYVRNASTKPSIPTASSSYVMAGLPPSVYPAASRLSATNHVPLSTGYVRPEEVPSRTTNFPKLGCSPTKSFKPESLPILSTLPSPTKHESDSSYIQLQSLDSAPSLKSVVRNTVPSKPATSNGYVNPRDAVITKHLNNMLTANQLAEESVILDPAMSPDAYCRFSWSNNPTNDNLHSILSDSSVIDSQN